MPNLPPPKHTIEGFITRLGSNRRPLYQTYEKKVFTLSPSGDQQVIVVAQDDKYARWVAQELNDLAFQVRVLQETLATILSPAKADGLLREIKRVAYKLRIDGAPDA